MANLVEQGKRQAHRDAATRGEPQPGQEDGTRNTNRPAKLVQQYNIQGRSSRGKIGHEANRQQNHQVAPNRRA